VDFDDRQGNQAPGGFGEPSTPGYGNLPNTIDEFQSRYRESKQILANRKARVIAAGVDTQITDVE